MDLTIGDRMVTIDSADHDLVARYRWRVLRGREGRRFYAVAYVPGGSTIYMHRLIADTPPAAETDHVDRNGLNNRRSNLRTSTPSQNRANVVKRSGCSSRFKGVTWDRSRGRWQAKIQLMGRSRSLGRFDDETAAARAYDAAARAAWGEFAWLNFPEVPCG